MRKNIDVEQLSDEIFPEVIETYEKELKEKILAVEDNESLAALINASTEALRMHSERFTTVLIQRVVDEMNRED
ncbi:hypothetical protein [Sporosarcina sp. FSL K6-3457]|uniref:hypothetical protein n=1 Tax=Sporosarcina sp. FSL K6-3457 TaxID=2978204 RepID=UPI0030F64050